MAHYGSETAKRHYLYSNSARDTHIGQGQASWLETGCAREAKRQDGIETLLESPVLWGTSKLRDTQSLDCKLLTYRLLSMNSSLNEAYPAVASHLSCPDCVKDLSVGICPCLRGHHRGHEAKC